MRASTAPDLEQMTRVGSRAALRCTGSRAPRIHNGHGCCGAAESFPLNGEQFRGRAFPGGRRAQTPAGSCPLLGQSSLLALSSQWERLRRRDATLGSISAPPRMFLSTSSSSSFAAASGAHQMIFPVGLALSEDLNKLGSALHKELYGLFTFEAMEERERLERMWRRLHDEQSPSPDSSSLDDFTSGLSTQRSQELKAFVTSLEKMLADSGFQLITLRDLTMSAALQDHQGVMRLEVTVDESNLLNMSKFLASHENSPELGAVLIWQRGHAIERKTGFLFLRKLDYLQSTLLVFLIKICKAFSRQVWASSQASRQHLLDKVAPFESQRWGRAVIQAGREAGVYLVSAAYGVLVRWGAISKPRISLSDLKAQAASFLPAGVAVEHAGIGEAMAAAAAEARSSIEQDAADRLADRQVFHRLISATVPEDFTNDDRLIYFSAHTHPGLRAGSSHSHAPAATRLASKARKARRFSFRSWRFSFRSWYPGSTRAAGADGQLQQLQQGAEAAEKLQLEAAAGNLQQVHASLREWLSAFCRPVSLVEPVWHHTIVLYTPKQEPSAAKEKKGAVRAAWHWQPLETYTAANLVRRVKEAMVVYVGGSIDPALPRLIAKHNYSYSDAGVDGVGVQGGQGMAPQLIAYERVMVKNLRTLWPQRELRLRPLDNFKIDLATVSAAVALLFRVRLDSVLAQVSALGLCAAWVLGVLFRLQAQSNEYELETTRGLHEKTTARGINVIRLASEGALEQRMRRCVLLHSALAAHGPCHEASLSRCCQQTLTRICPHHPAVDLERVAAEAKSDALSIGLISQSECGTVFAAVEQGVARQRLRALLQTKIHSAWI